MSFIICVYVGEGIVMASDSRITYNKTDIIEGKILRREGVHTTDTTDKTFFCPNNCGISLCGDATLNEMPITGVINSFIRENITDVTEVTEIPNLLLKYFRSLEKIPNTSFLVAGYTKNKTEQKVYKVIVSKNEIESLETNTQGAVWDGEILTLIKLLKRVALIDNKEVHNELPNSEILWNYFTLQDAIDFAKYAVDVTINTMRFQNVVKTVGGPVDILIIKPDGAFWLRKKQLNDK